MKTKLSDIAVIQTGVFAKPGPLGDIVYLQGKHFGEDGQLVQDLLPDLRFSDIGPRHILASNDILFTAKGTRNFAVHYQGSEHPAAASTTFIVIRLKQRCEVSPAFLTWFLNSPETQTHLKQSAKGTAIASISKKTLEDLEIPIPSIQKQETILEIAKLSSKRNKLALRLTELQNQNIQITLQKAIYK